jgi:hypothetical protein
LFNVEKEEVEKPAFMETSLEHRALESAYMRKTDLLI